MKRKTIFLSLALILPVMVFVFLKIFGKNKFEIPVFHDKKVELVAGCDYKYTAPYLLPDSALGAIGWKGNEATLIMFSKMEGEGKMRLTEKFEPTRLQIVTLVKEDGKKLKCAFLLSDKFNAVLVDQKKRIRGYYQLSNREETDRLMVELSILLNDY
ncbi:MAG: hypothetical protein ACKVOQ_22755 [Cyclobacteriaceae bacterium]